MPLTQPPPDNATTLSTGMDELAAKIRAKFRRRHSAAVPGIPSLLSRSSVQTSGSQGSSLFRTQSGHTSASQNASGAHASGGSGSGGGGDDDRSRAGSSRLSVIDQDGEVLGDGVAGNQVDAGVGEEGVVAQGRAQGQARAPATAPARAPAREGADEIDRQQHLQLPLQPQPEAQSQSQTEATPSPFTVPSAGDDNTVSIPAGTHDDSSSDSDPSSAAAVTMAAPPPAPAPAAAQIPASTPARSTSESETVETSDVSGSDQHPAALPSRRLSSIHEQPSPGKNKSINSVSNSNSDISVLPISKQQHLPPPTHSLDDDDDDDIISPPGTVAPADTTVLSSGSGSSSREKDRDNARPRDAAALPTPKLATSTSAPLSAPGPATASGPVLGTSTTAATTVISRPLHIPLPLPSASFGPPSASNRSPTAGVYSAVGTAPSSPLARYSQTADSHPRPAPAPPIRPQAPVRRQSLLSNRQSTLINTLLRGAQPEDLGSASNNSDLNPDQLLPISGNMVMRKIWVKRPGGSATLVTINEDDVVDDVRDMILRKYANSLGRQFDSPDLTLRIRPGGNQQERMLGPEEPMARTLDAYFPSGQTIDDALVIDVPLRRTPRASPRAGAPHAPHIQYYVEDTRPPETANDYFGPSATSALPVTVTAPSNASGSHAHNTHAISVLGTGQVAQIPSPGGGRRARDYRERPERPRLGRQHTSSPTLINMASNVAHQGSIAAAAAAHGGTQAVLHHGHTRTRSRTHSETSDQSQANAPPAPAAGGIPIPTPPAAEAASAVPQRVSTTPPPRVSSPRPAGSARAKKSKKNVDHPSLPKGMLNGSVPPINVLIVEDNIINLKLLEAFVKRLKVRWSTAMNGRDAVIKWRGGGFHLVLMDIQLPIMSGLDATREIRRLERVNSIGVFSSVAATAPEEVKGEPDEKDKLENMELFKSPVIIVALTASSLQSDRHEALAAGCNDFLTKPVNFVWLERKVMEWGCMQALIDFDGWRKWKDFAPVVDERGAKAAAAAAAAQKAKNKKNRTSMTQVVTATA